jgi:LAGLIDADG-like domain
MKIYDINQIANYYFNDKYSTIKIGKIIGVSPATVSAQLKKHGYVLDNKVHDGNGRKLFVDKKFFKDIDNKSKAYLLGLIISDGYVDNYTKLSFVSKDIELVEMLKRELKSEHKLAKYDIFDKRTNKTYIRYSIQVSSKEIINDLNNLGVFSRKSFNCKMPNIPEKFFWHFVRGLFDGDGGVYVSSGKQEGSLRFSIIGSENLIMELKKIFLSYGLSDTKISITKYKSGNDRIVSILYYSFKDMLILKNKMYEDSENLRLTRKYDLFQTLKEFKRGSYDRTPNLRRIEMYDLDNNLIHTFNNIHDACAYIDVKCEAIRRVIRGERSQTKGYKFKYIT